jgi:hypothetical protein
LTGVAPLGLQQLSCNKKSEAVRLGSFTLYQRFEKKKKLFPPSKTQEGLKEIF